MEQPIRTSLRRYQFRITGADRESGNDIELTIDAMHEEEAMRRANHRGIFVSTCVPVKDPVPVLAGSPIAGAESAVAAPQRTFAQAVIEDKVVQDLMKRLPQLAWRFKRMDPDDVMYLCKLTPGSGGISNRELSHLRQLIVSNRNLPKH